MKLKDGFLQPYIKSEVFKLTLNTEYLQLIPSWYHPFLKYVPERELESIHMQIEFDRSSGTAVPPFFQELAEVCLKLYKNRKVRSRYFAYLVGRLATSAGKNKELKALVNEFENVPELKLWLGEILVGEGDYEGARQIYQECEKTISSDNPYPYLDLKLKKSNIVVATNEYEKGMEENEELMDLIDFIQRQNEGLNTSMFEFTGKCERVQILLELGKMQEAQELVEELLQKVDSIENQEVRGYIYVVSGLMNQYLGKLPESKELFAKAKEVYEGIGEIPSLTFVDGVIGVFAIIEGNRAKGEEILTDVIERFQELNSLFDVVQFSMILAQSYSGGDEKDKAHALVKKLDTYLDRMKEITQSTSIDVAQIAINNEDTKLAHKYLEKLRDSLDKNPSVYNQISLHNLESALQSTQANMNSGIAQTEKALKIAEKNEILPQVLTCKVRLASLNVTKWMYVENDDLLRVAQANLYDALMLIPSDNPNRIEFQVISEMIEQLLGAEFDQTISKIGEIEKEVQKSGWGDDILTKVQKNKEKMENLKGLYDRNDLAEDDIKILLYNTIRRLLIGLSGIHVDQVKTTEIRMILVVNEAGLPIFVKNFGTAGATEDLLLSGFLTALNSFSTVFSDTPEGHLKVIRHENYSIMVEIYLSYMIAMVCVEDTYEAHQKLHKLVTLLSKDEFIKFPDLSRSVERLPEFEESVDSKINELFSAQLKNSGE